MHAWRMAFLGALLLPATALGSSLITNGSFEAPAVPAGYYTNFGPGDTSIPGWTVVGASGTNVAIGSNNFTYEGVLFEAYDGDQYVDLTGSTNSDTQGLTQSVATTPGHQYQLGYFVGNTTGGTDVGTSSIVDVQVNGAAAYSDTNAFDATGIAWEGFTHTFVVAGATTSLTFLNGDPANDTWNGLDDVTLTDLDAGGAGGPAVPEPASLLVLAAGLLGLAGTVGVRRRWV